MHEFPTETRANIRESHQHTDEKAQRHNMAINVYLGTANTGRSCEGQNRTGRSMMFTGIERERCCVPALMHLHCSLSLSGGQRSKQTMRGKCKNEHEIILTIPFHGRGVYNVTHTTISGRAQAIIARRMIDCSYPSTVEYGSRLHVRLTIANLPLAVR